MLRALLTSLVCMSLAGCSGWVSDERLFGTGDWAHLDLNGPYENDLQIGEAPKRTILRTRPDGLIESIGPGRDDRGLTGLVQIKGGSGEYFLMVDRSDPPDGDGDQYYIAHLSDHNTLALFLPDCRGTSPVDGMEKVRDSWRVEAAVEEGGAPIVDEPVEPQEESEGSLVCKFSTKDALMQAGLEAERFLSADHVVAITPFATFSPADDEAE